MIRCGHEDQAMPLVDFIEKPPVAHAIAPSRRFPISKLLDIRAEVRGLAKGQVNVFPEFGFESALRRRAEAREVAQELTGFEDAIAWRQVVLGASWRLRIRPSAS